MKKLVFIVIVLFTVSTLYAQQTRIAVLPFEAVGVSEREASVITNLFEASLVKTGVYDVIEQTQMNAILTAQAQSLSGCIDDACAVEVGRLLAAEKIILGQLSNVGGRLVATAKIIDVALGKNVNADTVSAEDIGKMIDGTIELLANKLAGTSSADGGISSEYGQVFILTEPVGAEVFVNEISRGRTPLVLERVPFGEIALKAKYENMAGELKIYIDSKELVEIEIPMEVQSGSLLIKSSNKNVEVFYNDLSLGPLGTGLFKNLPAGEGTLILKGSGIVGRERINIRKDEILTVEVFPMPYGIVQYKLPDDAEAEVKGRGYKESISGIGMLELPVGDYTISLKGDVYDPYKEDFTVEKAGFVEINPELSYSEQFLARKAEALREEKYMELSTLINSTSNKISEETRAAEEKVVLAREVVNSVQQSGYPFHDLEQRGENLLGDSIQLRLDELHALLDEAEDQTDWNTVSIFSSYGVAAAGAVLSGVCYFLGKGELETYSAASNTAAAVESHDKLSLYAALQTTGLITTGVGAAAGTTFWLIGDKKDRWQKEIDVLSLELSQLKGELPNA